MPDKILDIGLTFDEDLGEFDIAFEDNDLVTHGGLETMVIISLYSDKRAPDGATLPDPLNTDRRGWWGDETAEKENDEIGSLLWLLNRAKTTEQNLLAAKTYVEEALQWMIDEDIAAKINVITERGGVVGNDRLEIKVEIIRRDGEKIAMEFKEAWEVQVNGS
jgi:phage gp46-like protein